ncbi:MAG: uroporphyrinogen-III C-methyltransferase [Candidatus Marinimicrobia bacterium]|nr:uroporphyrinogen-III C-methyltransferase [Candidatus Neomarinimicrobiota bacterium]MCF7829752.1 uroporphyrinogen-III C-methyltransferase [Candidatus Neomarinimicrobiota bacterium]MCF7881702.1 uroporphyrinogen-III C-methyltransferase [Candidatus Neomarinimicrobiota bacterium]
MKTGKVSLIGAGPGDPELLTVKAYRRIKAADIVMHDTLTTTDLQEFAGKYARVINVGKRPGDGSDKRTSQETVNEMLVREARNGKNIVRLKGGDPFVFGRGGEEAVYLAAEGIPFEVIPGISSVLAAPAAAGIPLTHRNVASSFTVITGHEDPTKDCSALDWSAIAGNVKSGGTLVILMGVRRLEQNVRQLLANGLSGGTPAAVIEKATTVNEFTLSGTLESIPAQTRAAGISPPAIFVIGDVVDVQDQLQPIRQGVTAVTNGYEFGFETMEDLIKVG